MTTRFDRCSFLQQPIDSFLSYLQQRAVVVFVVHTRKEEKEKEEEKERKTESVLRGRTFWN